MLFVSSYVGSFLMTIIMTSSLWPSKSVAGAFSAIRRSTWKSSMTTTALFSSSSASSSSSDELELLSQARALGLFRHTPLVRSRRLSEELGRDTFLKLDYLQPSGSFKDRGVAYLCYSLQQQTSGGLQQIISSSGGNAGLAAATVGATLQVPVHVVVPETTKPLVVQKLQALGAQVTIHGENWNAADGLAREIVSTTSKGAAAYVPPYEHPLLWTGHSTVVDEIIQDLEQQLGSSSSSPPSVVAVSVGGGGLLCGVIQGLNRYYAKTNDDSTTTTTVVAMETKGTASLYQSVQADELVRLPSISSIATSLGALQVSPTALEWSQSPGSPQIRVESAVCTDAQAVQACYELSLEQRVLVEPACGAALTVGYLPELQQKILQPILSTNNKEGPVVLQVCGGSGVNLQLLQQWMDDVGVSHTQ